jgi:RHS repeat-associated protein
LIKDYLWMEGMTPVAQISAVIPAQEEITYLHTDHLMTNRLATDQIQSIVWRWEGEAFGNTPAEELAGISVNLRFPGQYYDQETNLHYNWNRYYDPELGRYITSDPIGLMGGFNTYNYVTSNPIAWYDFIGQAPQGGPGSWGPVKINPNTGQPMPSGGKPTVIDPNTGKPIDLSPKDPTAGTKPEVQSPGGPGGGIRPDSRSRAAERICKKIILTPCLRACASPLCAHPAAKLACAAGCVSAYGLCLAALRVFGPEGDI